MSINPNVIDEQVTVVGAGAWGTTLAIMLATRGVRTSLVTHSRSQADVLVTSRQNERYLPGIELPVTLTVTFDWESALNTASIVLLVVPSQRMRMVAEQALDALQSDAVVVSCAKGLERESLARMSSVIMDSGISPERVCAMSGPNLAREIALGLPASTVVAGASHHAVTRAQRILSSPQFRVYTSDDIIGVELGGSLKNVIALGAGAVDGMQIGHNAKAAFIARGLAEMTRLGVAAGANPLTFGGLSGLGDLIATCESPLSRNRTFGERLGKGVPVERAAGDSPHVVEGVMTTEAAVALARRYDVEMPIADAVHDVLRGRLAARDVIERLMTRDVRPELDIDRDI